MASIAKQMGIKWAAAKPHSAHGTHIEFVDRNGDKWRVTADLTGYFYPYLNNAQMTSTAYGYSFCIEDALLKGLSAKHLA